MLLKHSFLFHLTKIKFCNTLTPIPFCNTQLENENVHLFVTQLRILSKKAFPGVEQNVTDTFIADQFIDGLKSTEIQIKLKVARPTLNSLSEITELASRYEEVLNTTPRTSMDARKINTESNYPIQDQSRDISPDSRHVSFEPTQRCYRCNQTGHIRPNCPQIRPKQRLQKAYEKVRQNKNVRFQRMRLNYDRHVYAAEFKPGDLVWARKDVIKRGKRLIVHVNRFKRQYGGGDLQYKTINGTDEVLRETTHTRAKHRAVRAIVDKAKKGMLTHRTALSSEQEDPSDDETFKPTTH
ncbi:Transposon Ty3-I Gag-Pol poly [Brachionus plicatilis]|uniref:Transposon Ty3-I Gag-Pol poly n=1 Tax=Brachionus plicatilis TaxID=10195 RepID=A0A3M7QSY1_BRAPC|nr:Transposon Ty3-I Gag-Pol poly [Brachionus plicatilis]